MGYGLADSGQTNMAFNVYLDLTEGMVSNNFQYDTVI